MPFAKNNVIEFNHLYHCMTTTVDGAGLYLKPHESRNPWRDNLFQKDGSPPTEFIKVMQALAGLEPACRSALLGEQPTPCEVHALTDPARERPWAACQFDLPEGGRGVVQVIRPNSGEAETVLLKLRGLDRAARYELRAYAGRLAPADKTFYEGTFFGTCDTNLFTTYLTALGNLPILSEIRPAALDLPPQASGHGIVERGLPVQLPTQPSVLWIAYHNVRR